MANPGHRAYGFPEQQHGQEPGRIPSTPGESSGVAGTVKEKAQEVASAVGQTAERAWDTTRQAAQQAADYAQEAWGSARGFMGRYPLATLAFGLGLGFLLARLLWNRNADYMINRMSEHRYQG